jgi:hypothetical protein
MEEMAADLLVKTEMEVQLVVLKHIPEGRNMVQVVLNLQVEQGDIDGLLMALIPLRLYLSLMVGWAKVEEVILMPAVAVVAIMVAEVLQKTLVAVVVVAIRIQPYVAILFTRKVLRLVRDN